MRRFLVDTDTASDDAVAMIMALRHDAVHVEAFTVVAGNVPLDQAVQNALYTVELCGENTPVFSGAKGPLLRDLVTAQHVHGRDGFGDIGLELSGRQPAGSAAAQVIVETVKAHPGAVTLVALGPLTNLATALLWEPAIARAVDRCVIMGGTGRLGPGNVTPNAEYNFWADPEAVRVVLRSGMPIELVGWDISIASAVVTPERQRQLLALPGPYGKFAIDIQATLQEYVSSDTKLAGPDFPDPIAMAYALDPSPATSEYLAVDIAVGDGPMRGALIVDHFGFTDAVPQATMVTCYPTEAFFDQLMTLLTASNP